MNLRPDIRTPRGIRKVEALCWRANFQSVPPDLEHKAKHELEDFHYGQGSFRYIGQYAVIALTSVFYTFGRLAPRLGDGHGF
ncbi:hypothetical protein CEXT_352861 [Caerostris extrusa]|uniref:Uncharacterized protein n=1 Tax=Caerostris extrusa TaxID=172846 RepID=A0AAV4MHQ4_CAEEX|nr:hypothetical protein CEXT_352861 [Caerostris extrusa]